MKFFTVSFLFFSVSLLHPLVLATDTIWFFSFIDSSSVVKNVSEKPVGIAFVDEHSLLIVAERRFANGSRPIPIIYNTNKLGNVTWDRQISVMDSTLYDMAIDKKASIAYLLLSSNPSNSSTYSEGALLSLSDLGRSSKQNILFKTNSPDGNTKFFSCKVDDARGDIYITGGTNANLYNNSEGLSDAIVVRISSNGVILASSQFGTKNNEFGRSLAVSSDSSLLAVSIQQETISGGYISAIYLLNAISLQVVHGPSFVNSYSIIPKFLVSDTAISIPASNDPRVITMVECGKCLTVPDRGSDVYLNIVSILKEDDTISNSAPLDSSTVYLDGAEEAKRDDFATSVQIGSDGNIYAIGYTSSNEDNNPSSVSLLILSPTGKTLYRTEKVMHKASISKIIPVSAQLFDEDGIIRIVFTGTGSRGGKQRIVVGYLIPPKAEIPKFEGFGELAEEAGTDENPVNDKQEESPSSGPNLIIISTIAIGCAVIVLFVIMICTIMLRRRTIVSPNCREISSTVHDETQTKVTNGNKSHNNDCVTGTRIKAFV